MKTRVPIQEYLDAIKEIQDAGEYPSGRVVGRRVGECRQTAERQLRSLEKMGLIKRDAPPQSRPNDELSEAEIWQRARDVRSQRPEEIEAAEERKPSAVETWVQDWRDGEISRSFQRLFRYEKNSASGPELQPVRVLEYTDRRRKGFV